MNLYANNRGIKVLPEFVRVITSEWLCRYLSFFGTMARRFFDPEISALCNINIYTYGT